eukprot:GHVU01014042.1.p1 GENE.GHVU01014042.1~~GHVU01014042.1.p1  ORF type:complete len:215 (+),score=27.40 GHVU01014042.1:51-695(+)
MRGIYTASVLLLLHLFVVGKADSSTFSDSNLGRLNLRRLKKPSEKTTKDDNDDKGGGGNTKKCPSTQETGATDATFATDATESTGTTEECTTVTASCACKDDLITSANNLKQNALVNVQILPAGKAYLMVQAATVMAEAAKIAEAEFIEADSTPILFSWPGNPSPLQFRGDVDGNGFPIRGVTRTPSQPGSAVGQVLYQGEFSGNKFSGLGVQW